MHAPIYGSQRNPPAKLYKRFTYDMALKTPASAVTNADLTIDIVIEMNAYKTFHGFRWVEVSDKSEGTSQPLSGLLAPSGDWSIKFNGAYMKKTWLTPCDVSYPETGDLVVIEKELWQIGEGVTRSKYKSMKDLAVFTLPLKKIL